MRQRRISSLLLCLTFVLAVCAAQDAAPQNPSQPKRMRGTIRVDVAETPVDVIVVDKKGKPVLDLTRSDFSVSEDGVEQSIIHFALNSYVSDSPVTPPTPDAKQPDTQTTALATPGQRTIVICFGSGWQGSRKAIDKAMDFVRNHLRPSDQVAVMAYNRATEFTTDHARIIETIERYRTLSQEIETRTAWMASGMLHRGIILARQQARIDEIFASPGGGMRQTMAIARPDEQLREIVDREALADRDVEVKWQMVDGAEMALRYLEDMMNERYEAALQMDDYLRVSVKAVDDIPLMVAAVQYLRYMEGEKHLLYLTPQGFYVQRGNDDLGLASMASDARVRIHVLQTGGVELRNPVPGMDISSLYQKQSLQGAAQATSRPRAVFDAYAQFPVDDMERFASYTGGHAYSGMDLNKAFQAISQQTAQSYSLGYVPPPRNNDGRFRKITVKVKRPGLQVFHRRGYYDQAAERIYDAEQFLTCSRVTAAVRYTEPLTEIDFDLDGSGARAGDALRLRSKLNVRPKAELYSEKPGPEYAGKLYVAYFVLNGSGQVLFKTTDDLTMDLKPETYQKVMSEGFPLEKEFIAKGKTKDYWLKVVVFDPKNDRVGSALQKVKMR